jgi:NifU-like protein involved in Fe-S cluster formation
LNGSRRRHRWKLEPRDQIDRSTVLACEKMPRKLTKQELQLLEKSGYSEKAIELYVNKVDVGVLKKPDISKTRIGPCGHVIRLYPKADRNSTVEDAKFCHLGCPGSAFSASAMTKPVKGKAVEEARRLTEYDILGELGGLPKPKLDGPKLAITALQKAIAEYEKSNPV